MSKNSNLVHAKQAKNDRFWTRLEDIETELSHYPGAFEGKSVYLPCDDARYSQFWRYFRKHFSELGLRRLTATCWNEGGHGFLDVFECSSGKCELTARKLEGDGDFLSKECLDILDSCDIVVTNLPFSLFREYVKTMMDHEKDFIVIGGKNGGKYQDTIGYVVDGRMRLGVNEGHGSMKFNTPDGAEENVGSYWYTTLVPDVPVRKLELSCVYGGHEDDYPEYVNYPAIEVSKLALIPKDYAGKMGVPVTFLEYYDPAEWILYGTNATVLENAEQDPEIKANSHLYRRHNLYLLQEGGQYKYKRVYDRLIVQRRILEALARS